jgi:hypothetical protein
MGVDVLQRGTEDKTTPLPVPGLGLSKNYFQINGLEKFHPWVNLGINSGGIASP